MVNSKIGPKFSIRAPITLGIKGSELTKLFHVTCHGAGMIIGYNFLGATPPPLKISEGKKRPKFDTQPFGPVVKSRTHTTRIKNQPSKLFQYRETRRHRWLINTLQPPQNDPLCHCPYFCQILTIFKILSNVVIKYPNTL